MGSPSSVPGARRSRCTAPCRPAHRAAEPRSLRRPPRARARPCPPRRARPGRADRRPRPVQAHQRLARPPGRRRAAVRRGAAAEAAMRATDTVASAQFMSCDGVESEGEALALAQRLAAVLEAPLRVGGGPVYASASFGVAFAGPASDATSLLRDADAALYRAKASAAGAASSSTRRCARRYARLGLETGPRHASTASCPALPAGGGPGHRPPDGLRGAHALDPSGARSGRPRRLHPGRRGLGADRPARPLGAARGLYARRLARPGRRAGEREPRPAAARLPRHRRRRRRALEHSGLEPSKLVLELTESALLEETDSPISVLEALKALGVSLVLDDFGTATRRCPTCSGSRSTASRSTAPSSRT